MNRILFLFIWLLAAIISFNPFRPMNACADKISFRGNLNFSYTDSKNTNRSTGQTISSDAYRLDQIYSLDLAKTIYPYLTFETGSLFKWEDTTTKSESTRTDIDVKTLRPYARLRLNNPIYQASVEFRRNQREEKVTGQPKTEDTIDTFESFLGWSPLDLPRITLRYNQTHTYDDPETRDQIVKLLILRSDYTSWQNLDLNYVYTRQDREDRLANFDTLDQTHLGRVEYDDNFLDGRLFLSSNYRIRYNRVEVPGGTGTGEVALQRSLGLSIVNNNPADGPLDINNALINGNLTAPAGVDIGLAGDETRFTNIGLDLGIENRVDQVRLWVDQSLTPAVANSFSWEVYTSPDNRGNSTWTLVATIFPADFDSQLNRFEILFPEVNTRFIKVVTTPLSPAVPGSGNFQNINVTEMQAFITVSGEEQDKITTIEHNYDLNLSGRLSDKTRVGYNLNLNFRKQDPTDQERTRLNNSLFVSHVFNRIFATTARVERSDEEVNSRKTVEHNYSISLRGAYLPTFDQSLSFSGTSIKEEDDSSDNFSIFLRNNARLYPGLSLFVDSGFSWDRRLASSEVEKDVVVRAGTDIVPHDKFNMNMTYRISKPIESERQTKTEYELGAFYLPFRALSLSANVRYIDEVGTNNLFQNYFLTWRPFPDGDLQVFFTYSELFRSTTNERQTSIGPGLSWSVGNHFSLEMTYSMLRSRSNAQKLDSNSLLANLRMIF